MFKIIRKVFAYFFGLCITLFSLVENKIQDIFLTITLSIPSG